MTMTVYSAESYKQQHPVHFMYHRNPFYSRYIHWTSLQIRDSFISCGCVVAGCYFIPPFTARPDTNPALSFTPDTTVWFGSKSMSSGWNPRVVRSSSCRRGE